MNGAPGWKSEESIKISAVFLAKSHLEKEKLVADRVEYDRDTCEFTGTAIRSVFCYFKDGSVRVADVKFKKFAEDDTHSYMFLEWKPHR